MKNIPLRALAATAMPACGLTAQAQTGVTTFGLIDLSIGSTKAPGGTAVKGVDSGKMTTSYVGIKGLEDLGGMLMSDQQSGKSSGGGYSLGLRHAF